MAALSALEAWLHREAHRLADAAVTLLQPAGGVTEAEIWRIMRTCEQSTAIINPE